jgi:hypothetical protein
MFVPLALQRSEKVAITVFCEQAREDRPVAFAGDTAIRALQMILQVLVDRVVVEQRVVDIDQEHYRMTKRLPKPPSRQNSRPNLEAVVFHEPAQIGPYTSLRVAVRPDSTLTHLVSPMI